MSPLLARIESGDRLVAGQALGEPSALLEALFADLDVPVELFLGMSLSSVFDGAPAGVRLVSFVGMASNARLLRQGRMSLVPCHMSDLPALMRDGPLAVDVALVLATPPDRSGMCHLGLGADYIAEAVAGARVVLAELNPNVPVIAGDTTVPMSRIDGFVRSDRSLPVYERATPTPVERAIAARVAEYARDGTCIQVGIGRLGEAVLAAVSGRRHLGFHAGMIGDTALEMVRDGVITNARKAADTGESVAGSLLGTATAVKLAATDPSLRLRSVAYTHDPAVLARIDSFLCVNSALEVDVAGQVNAEQIDGRYVGGIGGSVDFLRGAGRAPRGRSIVALPATGRGGKSRIVPAVEKVTALGADVDVLITEHGVAELRGIDEDERAHRIIAIAAPEHREHLSSPARGGTD